MWCSCAAADGSGRSASAFPESKQTHERDHLCPAAGAKGAGVLGRRIGRPEDEGASGMKGDALAHGLGGGMAKPVSADRPHGQWQDMAEVAGDELDAGHFFHPPGVAVSPVFPREGDARFVDGKDAGVGDGGAADIGAEILDGPPAVTEGLEMHAPVFFPNAGIDGGQRLIGRKELAKRKELACEELPERASQHGLRHEEPGALDANHAARDIDARPRHDAVEMRMEEQAPVPSVKDHREPSALGAEPARVGKRGGKRLGRRREKHLMDLPGSLREEEGAQLFGHGERDHEVGSPDAFGQFAPDPPGGGLPAALRTGAVVAGMEGEAARSALLAGFSGVQGPRPALGKSSTGWR